MMYIWSTKYKCIWKTKNHYSMKAYTCWGTKVIKLLSTINLAKLCWLLSVLKTGKFITGAWLTVSSHSFLITWNWNNVLFVTDCQKLWLYLIGYDQYIINWLIRRPNLWCTYDLPSTNVFEKPKTITSSWKVNTWHGDAITTRIYWKQIFRSSHTIYTRKSTQSCKKS
jgi:hypothetical protein